MMRRPTAQTLGALALAAALATSSTAAFAAPPSGEVAFYATKKKATTLAGLSPEVRRSAIQVARSRPNGLGLAAEVGTSQMTDAELDLNCGGDWFITWEEDAAGNPVTGTFNLYCAGETYSLP